MLARLKFKPIDSEKIMEEQIDLSIFETERTASSPYERESARRAGKEYYARRVALINSMINECGFDTAEKLTPEIREKLTGLIMVAQENDKFLKRICSMIDSKTSWPLREGLFFLANEFNEFFEYCSDRYFKPKIVALKEKYYRPISTTLSRLREEYTLRKSLCWFSDSTESMAFLNEMDALIASMPFSSTIQDFLVLQDFQVLNENLRILTEMGLKISNLKRNIKLCYTLKSIPCFSELESEITAFKKEILETDIMKAQIKMTVGKLLNDRLAEHSPRAGRLHELILLFFPSAGVAATASQPVATAPEPEAARAP